MDIQSDQMYRGQSSATGLSVVQDNNGAPLPALLPLKMFCDMEKAR